MTIPMTADQFDVLPEPQAQRYELSRGELVEVPALSPLHNLVRDNLSYCFIAYRRRQTAGLSLCSSDFALTPDTVRRPDLAFIAADRRSEFPMDQRLRGVPDIAAEIVSASELYDAVLRKVNDYLRAGVKYVWVISLEHRSAVIWTVDAAQFVAPHNPLSCPELLPEFSVRMEELFVGA